MTSTPRIPNLLAGKDATDDRTFEVRAPWDDALLAVVPWATPDQLDQALAAAHASRRATAALPTHARAAILRRVSDALRADADALARQVALEAAKPITLARGEVARAALTFQFAADELTGLRGETLPLDASPAGAGRLGITRRFPAGVVAAITPFNFPLNLVAHKLAPAVMAVTPIVLKPAEQTPLSALALGRLLVDAGWPADALSVLCVPVADAAPLVEDPRVAVLTFTGSDTVGWQLKARAGSKRVLLELGGDAAVLVEPDMHPDRGGDADRWHAMVRRIAFGAFAYAGQVCISVQRVLVHEAIHDAFVDDLVAALPDAAPVGAPLEDHAVASALLDDRAQAKVRRLVDDALARGATLRAGGFRPGPSRLVDPIVLTDVPAAAALAREEAFGPVVCVAPYADFDAALDAVDASRFGLQAGLFSGRLDRAMAAFERLEVGALVVGDIPTWRVDHMPYGGVKGSGFGREGLRYAYEDYTEERLLVLPTS